MLGTARLLGQTLGTALVALMMRLFVHADGAHLCLLTGAACALLAGIVSSLRLSQPAPSKHD